MAFINMLLDFFDLLKSQVDADKFEVDIHFLADFNSFLEGDGVGLDGLIEFSELIIDFSLT